MMRAILGTSTLRWWRVTGVAAVLVAGAVAPGAVVKVAELGITATADSTGKGGFRLPLNEGCRYRVYTFVTTARSSSRQAVVRLIYWVPGATVRVEGFDRVMARRAKGHAVSAGRARSRVDPVRDPAQGDPSLVGDGATVVPTRSNIRRGEGGILWKRVLYAPSISDQS